MQRIKAIITDMRQSGSLPRVLKNQAELECFRELTAQGWLVTKRGWPDFACFKGKNLALVEVKPKLGHRLKRDQFRLLTALSSLGIKCFLWTPDEGLQLIPGIPIKRGGD